jgi:hypothetical protein
VSINVDDTENNKTVLWSLGELPYSTALVEINDNKPEGKIKAINDTVTKTSVTEILENVFLYIFSSVPLTNFLKHLQLYITNLIKMHMFTINTIIKAKNSTIKVLSILQDHKIHPSYKSSFREHCPFSLKRIP